MSEVLNVILDQQKNRVCSEM